MTHRSILPRRSVAAAACAALILGALRAPAAAASQILDLNRSVSAPVRVNSLALPVDSRLATSIPLENPVGSKPLIETASPATIQDQDSRVDEIPASAGEGRRMEAPQSEEVGPEQKRSVVDRRNVDGARAALDQAAASVDAAASFDGGALKRALERAVSSEYTTTLLRRRSEGGDRLVVILGERHQKSAEAANAGHDVMSFFTHYALEGYDTTSTWGRRFNWTLEQRGRRRRVAKNPTQYSHGTVIQDAADQAVARESAALKIQSEAFRLMDQLPKNERSRLLFQAAEALAAGKGDTLISTADGKPLMTAAEMFPPGFNPLAPEEDRQTQSQAPDRRPYFDLEAGHRPDLAEKISVWEPTVDFLLPHVWVALLVSALGAIFGSSLAGPLLPQISKTAGQALFAFLIYIYAGYEWELWRPKSKLGILFPLAVGMTQARDKTMAENLARASSSLPPSEPLLAIVGRGHLPGMRRRLIERHGFESVDLDSLTGK